MGAGRRMTGKGSLARATLVVKGATLRATHWRWIKLVGPKESLSLLT